MNDAIVLMLGGAALGIGWTYVAYRFGRADGYARGRADESNVRRADRHKVYMPADTLPAQPTAPAGARSFVMGATLRESNAIRAAAPLTHVDGIPIAHLRAFAACSSRADWPHANAHYSACRAWVQRHGLYDGKAWRADLSAPFERRLAMLQIVHGQTLPDA